MYCAFCGTELKPAARFCRACGSPQAAATAPPPPPAHAAPPAPAQQARQPAGGPTAVAGSLAIIGGVLLCFLTLYATVYEPLHEHYSVNFGQAVHFGDVLAFVTGAAAIAIGVLLLTRSGSPLARGPWLLLAGVPVLIVTVLWTFPDTFHVDVYSRPFFLGYVYFAEFGLAELGSRYVQVPLVCACAMLVGAGLIITLAPRRPAAPAL